MVTLFRFRQLTLAAAVSAACGPGAPALAQQINPTVLAPAARHLIPQGSMKVTPRESASTGPQRHFNGHATHPDRSWHKSHHHREHQHHRRFIDDFR